MGMRETEFSLFSSPLHLCSALLSRRRSPTQFSAADLRRSFGIGQKMVIPPVRLDRVTKFLKPYVLRMHFTNKFVNAQVVHTPTATVASSASTQEKALRLSMEKAKENTRDVAAAAKIGKILGERLLHQNIPAVSVFLKKDQKYHGKVKAVIDSLSAVGVKLI
ncbi:hypothetical protein MIMGU_mgv1a015272mg [Erythranthe guttata]|uniref:50S ribosomal protein L18 n=2 Tax=Erythranthe guttata TaxID=4155 RepID=A0A022PS76_ERYGU|nr:hypothetical protein MIMGU_mgv1a015272mg [Erythranthe guttata]